MTAVALCILALIACFLAGRRSIAAGVIATSAVGYFYGIVRANLPVAASHFIFDAGSVGFLLAVLTRRITPAERFKLGRVMPWLVALFAWPTFMLLVPLQNPLIELVGWRGQVFFLPYIAVGAMVDGAGARRIAVGLGVLSLIELGFAIGEIHLGVPFFYPRNEVTELIYRSTDVIVGSTATYRLPGTFVQAASFGGQMAMVVPLLLGAMVQERRGSRTRLLLLAAIGASAVCVFLSASRSTAVLLFVLALATTFSGRARNFPWFGWIALIAVVSMLVVVSPRMRRFVSLEDTQYVKTRISHSVNENIFELAIDYPLGNGLGGGGTSIPYFLQPLLRNPVMIENEYGRLMLEQGVPGLALWLAFIIWTLSRPLATERDPWSLGKWLARVGLGFSLVGAQTGTGLLTSIPGTALLLFYAGWIAVPNLVGAARAARRPDAAAGPAAMSRGA